MINIVLDDLYRGLLGERHSIENRLNSKWNYKYGTILENQDRQLNEVNMASDSEQFRGFVLSIAKKSMSMCVAKDLVSIQPISLPTAMVFFYDPYVETASTEYQLFQDSYYNDENFDLSKGSKTVNYGILTSITETNYLSGSSVIFDYSGGSDGLSTLSFVYSENSGDKTGLSGINGTKTVSPTGIGSPNNLWDDNYTTNWTPTITTGFSQFQFTAGTLSPYIESYSITVDSSFHPQLIVLSGSQNGSNWNELDRQTAPSFTGQYDVQTFSITPTSAYTYYKLYFTGTPFFIVSDISLNGSQVYRELDYAITPQTWSNDLFKQNKLESIVNNSGYVGTMSARTRYTSYGSQEGTSDYKQVKFIITGSQIEAKSRKLKTNWTSELKQDLMSLFTIGAEDHLSDVMALEIATELDREIIRDLINIAQYKADWHYDYNSLSAGTNFFGGDQREIGIDISGMTKGTKAEHTLSVKINQIAGIIQKNTFHKPDWIVCSTKVGSIIEKMKEFDTGNYGVDQYDIKKSGKLESRYVVYIDPNLPDEICLIGSEGIDMYDTGYIYAPYIPLCFSEKVHDPETLFEWSMNATTRYAKKVTDPKKYGVIYCVFPDDYDVVNGD